MIFSRYFEFGCDVRLRDVKLRDTAAGVARQQRGRLYPAAGEAVFMESEYKLNMTPGLAGWLAGGLLVRHNGTCNAL